MIARTLAASSGSSTSDSRGSSAADSRPVANTRTGARSSAGASPRNAARISAGARSASSSTTSAGRRASRARASVASARFGRPARPRKGPSPLHGERRLRSPQPSGSCPSRMRRPARPARPSPRRPAASAPAVGAARRRGRPAAAPSPRRARAETSATAASTSSEGSWRRIASCSRRSLRRRLDADLLDQCPPGVSVGLERLGLAPAPVQREHPLRVSRSRHGFSASSASISPTTS